MFGVGMSAMLAQVIMARELMVVFFGNELALGVIFAVWLVMVGAGSLIIRPLVNKGSENTVRWVLTLLLVGLAFILPLLVFTARALRIFFNVPMGEYMAFAPMIAGSFLSLAPVCLVIGIIFPYACRLAGAEKAGVAAVYTVESAGSMFAGMLFSFVLVFFLSPMAVAVFTAFIGVCAAAAIAPRPAARNAGLALAALLMALLIYPAPVKKLEQKAVELRWRAFGVLPPGGRTRLLETRDSKHQNLALTEFEEQKALYGNGQIMFVFPDAISAEQKISFIMAQKPFVRKVLLIGGDPATYIPELLKYPLKSLTQIELDGAINEILLGASNEYRRSQQDARLRQCLMDGPYFVKQTKEIYDVVIIEAPEPATIALNRFYTVEFYRAIRRILAPDGFLYTSVQSSEQLQDEAGSLTASIYKALHEVFPRVLVSAGTPNQFFAGSKGAALTFDGQTLYERWRRAGIKTKYFRPEYFLNADEISAEKVDFVKRRIASFSVPENSALKPVSAFYTLFLWSKYSGSRLEFFFKGLQELKIGWIFAAIGAFFAATIICIFAALRAGKAPVASVLSIVIVTTGFTGMAVELILIFIFQTLLGYIYASIGMLIAMFMLGLALGASAIKRSFVRSAGKRWLILLELDLLLLMIALALTPLLTLGGASPLTWPVAGIIYLLTLLTGWAGGAQFVLAANLLSEGVCGMRQARNTSKEDACNAALLNAVDLSGAALGGLCAGIILLPVFGFGHTCYLLALLKFGTFLLIGLVTAFGLRRI